MRHHDMYCEFMSQAKDWERSLTKSVAAQVRRYRQQRGMTVQELSDRCADLGVPIPRPVLSNLETGRRESVTLAELIVLALALGVPPLLLVVPVVDKEQMELIPRGEVRSVDALAWFAGDGRLVPTYNGLDRAHGDDEDGTNELVRLYLHHDVMVDLLSMGAGHGPYSDEELRNAAEEPDGGPGELKWVRRYLREAGVRIPALPPELAAVDPPEMSLGDLSDRMRHAVRRA